MKLVYHRKEKMNFILMLLLINQGVQIRTPDTDKFDIVRTDKEPARNHHPILDDPQFAHLLPFTVTIKTKDLAIHTINVVFDVIDNDGVTHSFGKVFTMPAGQFVIGRHKQMNFYPGGRMSLDIGKPLMVLDSRFTNINEARSVTFSIDYIQFEDNTVWGPNTHGTERNIQYALGRRHR